METMTAAYGPTRHNCDDNFRHKANKTLYLEYMKPTKLLALAFFTFILIAIFAANSLIATGTKSPSAIFWRRSVASEKNRANIGRATRVIQSLIELIDCLRPKGIAHFGTIESDTNRALFEGAMIGNILKIKAWDRFPTIGVKQRGNHKATLLVVHWDGAFAATIIYGLAELIIIDGFIEEIARSQLLGVLETDLGVTTHQKDDWTRFFE